MYFLYDCLQCLLVLFMLPKVIWGRMVHGRYKHSLAFYLALSLPQVKPKKGKVFLLYAVSMGETKAAASLFVKMKESYPSDQFYIISKTETGHAEAKKSMKTADGHFLLPVDFSWSIKRFLKRLEPDVVIIVESDFWFNFLRISKQLGALVFLVSGKISSRSFRRFQKLSFFAKRLFSLFDLICTQNVLFKERFMCLGVQVSNVVATGNLKFDTPFAKTDIQKIKEELGIQERDRVLVVASTHPGEEEAILKALAPLWEQIAHLRVIVVPRHPHRFVEVEEMLIKHSFSTISYSRISQKTESEQVILIDAMGLLLSIYQIADLAIVGGSFLKTLKGHNIFEPIQAGVPVLFGPYMSDQKDLVECVLTSGAGVQLSLESLEAQVEGLLQNSSLRQAMQKHGEVLLLQMKGSSVRTWEGINAKICTFKKETFVI